MQSYLWGHSDEAGPEKEEEEEEEGDLPNNYTASYWGVIDFLLFHQMVRGDHRDHGREGGEEEGDHQLLQYSTLRSTESVPLPADKIPLVRNYLLYH